MPQQLRRIGLFRNSPITLLLLLVCVSWWNDALARRDSSPASTSSLSGKSSANHRIKNLTGEDRELFLSLNTEQQQDLRSGRIRIGYNEWMVRMAVGEPFFKTVQNTPKKKQEDVWLYTKKIEDKKISQDKILDSQTGWPSIRRVTQTKACVVGDFFIVLDRDVVVKIADADAKKVYGPCKIDTTEEITPITKKGKKRS